MDPRCATPVAVSRMALPVAIRSGVAGSVARLPSGSAADGDGVPPADVYKIAVEEYRFQAQYNWSRTQYLLAFNVGILAAATAVASQPGKSAALVFGLGAIAALLSMSVVQVQHGYYRAARDHMKRIEAAVALPPDQRIDTTANLGGRRRKVLSVNQVVYLLLASVAVADLVGRAIDRFSRIGCCGRGKARYGEAWFGMARRGMAGTIEHASPKDGSSRVSGGLDLLGRGLVPSSRSLSRSSPQAFCLAATTAELRDHPETSEP